MKKFIIVLNLSVMFFNNYGQTQPENFYKFLEQYYINNPQDNGEGGEKENINRVNLIWSPRLFPHGNFNIAANAIYNYTNSFNEKIKIKSPTIAQTWNCIGPINTPSTSLYVPDGEGTGQIHVIAFDPNYNGTTNNVVYAGSSFGGLFKSIDNGQNWQVLNTDNQLPVASVSDIAIDKTNSNNIFISTGHRDNATFPGYSPNWSNVNPIFTVGIYRSTNNGLNWSAINDGLLSYFVNGGVIRRIIIHPSNGNILYAATTEGIFKTTNALSSNPTWQLIFTPTIAVSQNDSPDYELRGLEFKPGILNTIYASSRNIYRSTDSGNNWSKMTGAETGLDFSAITDFTVERINITVTPADPERLYAYIIGIHASGLRTMYIYMFRNNIWTQVYTRNASGLLLTLSTQLIAIAASPINANEVYFGFTEVMGTNDILATNPVFSFRSPYNGSGFHADVHALIFQPNVSTNPNLFCGNDGGVSVKDVSDINLGGWSKRNNGLAVATIWSFDDNEFDKDVMITGHQDCGVNITRKVGGNIEWDYIQGGDGHAAQIGKDAQYLGYYISNQYCSQYNFLTNTKSSEFFTWYAAYGRRPFDPQTSERALLPNTFKIVNHPTTNEMIWGFTELYKRKKDNSEPADEATPNNLWEIESDIGKDGSGQWARQINEFAISESNPNFIYLATGGADMGANSTWQLSPRLFKSITGGCQGNFNLDCFDDITSNLPLATVGNISPYVITGIAIHPTNPNKIWVSFTGFDPNYKVLFSDNGGTSWINTDSNTSLANLPVNGIVYQDGTNDLLYIATDAGVYYKDNSMTTWKKYGDIPNVRVVELKINYCANKLRAATFGRGVWDTDLMPFNGYSNELIITGINNVWSDKSINKNIRITNGGVLIINGKCSMPIKGKIIVEQGAKLIVNAGKITNNCGNLWQGIELQGNSTANQFTESNQGVVELNNGATIENAIQAIRTIKTNTDGTLDYAYTGGIVKANGAKFVNCKNGVRIETYHNVYGNYARSNRGYIQNCSFQTTNDAISSAQILGDYIYLQNVEGLIFNGNTFKNLNTIITDPNNRGFGIRSINAKYTVTDNTISFPCIFQGLNYGIFASNTNPLLAVTVTSCNFNKNYTGIGLKGVSNAWITSNTFSELSTATPIPRGVGLYLETCNNYKVEGNTFNGINGEYYGTLLYDYGIKNNMIYRNTYNSLVIGIQAGVSSDMSKIINPPPPEPVLLVPGLKLYCNQFLTTTVNDITVTSGQLGNPQGSCGSMTTTSNNQFSFNGAQSIWLNPGIFPVNYNYYPGTNNAPINTYPSNESLVIPYQCSAIDGSFIYSQACPSTLGGSGTSPISLITRISTTNQQLTPLLTKISVGNSQTLLNTVNSNLSSGQIKNAIITAGTVSDTILIAATKKTNPLPPGILKEIIIPNSPVTARVQAAINSVNLPAGIKADIQAAQTGTSARTILEKQISELQQQKDLSVSELMRYYLNDTTGTKIDSVIIFLNTQTDLDSKKQLIQAYLLKEDCSNANTILNQLTTQTTTVQRSKGPLKKAPIGGSGTPSDVILTAYEINDMNTFKQFYTIMADLCTQGKTLFDLTEVQKQTMYDIVAGNTSTSTAARSVLTMVYGEDYPEIIEDLIVSDDMTIRGTLYNNPTCSLDFAIGDTIVFKDSLGNIVRTIHPTITDNIGSFKFNFNDLIFLPDTAKYTIVTTQGSTLQDTIFKTIPQWIATSPVNLTLRKIETTLQTQIQTCSGDSTHFTALTTNAKQPITYTWNIGNGSTSLNSSFITYKYSTSGTYPITLTVSDARSCLDTVNTQITVPVCTVIFGTLYENADCGGMPVTNDTLLLKNSSGHIITTVSPIISNANGGFEFNPAEIATLDTTLFYTIATKSGYALQNITAKSIRQLIYESPLSINFKNVNMEWQATYNTPDSVICEGQYVDLKDNVYVLGEIYLNNTGEGNIAILKYNPSGNLIWSKFYNTGNFSNYGYAIYVDTLFNVYVTGSLQYPVYSKSLTLKYDSNGVLVWSKLYGLNTGYASSYSITTDNNLNVYITGKASDVNNKNGITTIKYDAVGNEIWVKRIENTTDNSGGTGTNIVFDKTNNIIVAGYFGSPLNSYSAIKYDLNGTLIWSALYHFVNASNSATTDLKIDNNANIFISGKSGLVKFDNSGTQKWSQKLMNSPKIGIDYDGNIWSTGYDYLSASYSLNKYDNSTGTILLNQTLGFSSPDFVQDASGNNYLLKDSLTISVLKKYSNSGNLIWTMPISNVLTSSYHYAISKNNNIYTTGLITHFTNYEQHSDFLTCKISQCPSAANSLRHGNVSSTSDIQILDANLQSLALYKEAEEIEETINVNTPYRGVSSSEYVIVFTNPNDGNFYFNYSLPENEKCSFTVLDPTGKKVYTIDIKSGRNIVMVNNNSFSNGLYYYQVTAGYRLIKTDKFVITK